MRTLSAIKELRHAIVKALTDANIDGIGSHVFEARHESVWPEEGLIAVVYTDDFTLEDERTSPKVYKITGQVIVDVIRQNNSDTVNDDLDDATQKVIETLQPMMPKEGFFGGITKRFVATGIKNNLSEAGEMYRGLQRITFSTQFSVALPVGGPTDDFLKANNVMTVGKGDGNKQEFTTLVRGELPSPEPDEDEAENGESDG